MPTNLRDVLAIGLFVVLASYVGFSGIRLGLYCSGSVSPEAAARVGVDFTHRSWQLIRSPMPSAHGSANT